MTVANVVQKPVVSRSRYWFRLLSVFFVVLSLALIVAPMLMGAVSVWGLTHPPCNPGSDPSFFTTNFEEANFISPNGLGQSGYFIPGTNGATMIVVPTYNQGRGAQLHYAQMFSEAGFSVLTFNSRVCTSQGWISLGYQEVEDVEAGFAYLKTRLDVDSSRIGLHGFSSATATSIFAAARIPEIRSLSVEGGYHDYTAVLELGNARNFFDSFYQVGFAGAYRLLTGDNIQTLAPIDTLDKLGSRPLLLIYGSTEVSLPGARQMLERALSVGVPAELWIVDGAHHGDYLWVAPEEYKRRVVGFHQVALLDAGAA
jgi:pimeloyl-ACP methyl ester carboxylesterase